MRLSVAMAVACLMTTGLSAADQAKAAIRKSTNIQAQGLAPALQRFAKERDVQIVYRSELVGDRTTAGAAGELTLDEALAQLLNDTGLTYQHLDDDGITIVPVAAESAATESSSRGSLWDRFRISQTTSSSSPQSGGSGARAEGKDLSSQEDKSRRIEEIVVTATKRAESVQDIPMSIAVISNEDIERRGLIGMEDYLRSIPGVNQVDQGPFSNAIVIRGITTSLEFENASGGPTVASFFGETPITGASGGGGGIDVRPVDIERIELLRGPQGTAYGSASLAGTLRILPAKPKLDGFGAKLAASYSNTSGFGGDNSMFQGVVNVPFVEDKFAVRAVGYRYDESGAYRNIAGVDSATIAVAENYGLGDFVRGYTQDDIGKVVSTGGRLGALWQVTDKLNIYLNLLTQAIRQDGQPFGDANYQQTNFPIAQEGRVRGEAGEINDTEIDLASLVLNYDLGWAALTSAVSRVDGSYSAAKDISVFLPYPASNIASNDFQSFTAETRLISQFGGRFQFLGGLFYEDVDVDGLTTVYWPGPTVTSPVSTDPMLISESAGGYDQRAIFGEVSYDLTKKFTVTVGGRYFDYKKEDRSLREGGFAGVPIGAGVPQNLESDEGGSSFKADLKYRPTQETLLYASWAEGFRLGRPTAGLPATCDANADGVVDGTDVSLESTRQVDSDFLEQYEVGGKFALLDRRVVVEASAYDIKWNGLPTTTFAPCNFGYLANLGAARSTGLDIQASLVVVDNLRLDFGAGYTNAELSRDAPTLPGSPQEGARLPGSPEISANLSAQYDFEVVGHKAFVRADSVYTGEFYQDFLETPRTRAGEYIKVDARAGVVINNLSVELFVRNLTNEDAFTWRSPNYSGPRPFAGYRLRPRTVGVQLGYSFGR